MASMDRTKQADDKHAHETADDDTDTETELKSLHGIIDSLSVDATSGTDGVERAIHDLFSALFKTCEDDNVALLKTILSCLDCNELCVDIELELLRSAIFNRSPRCARYLAGSVNIVNLCSVVRWLCSDKGDNSTFQILMDRGFKVSDCECRGTVALKHAIINTNEELVVACLKNGSDPNCLDASTDSESFSEAAVDEFSPLLCAILYSNTEIVARLLEYGADVAVNEIWGMTPLIAAVSAGKPEDASLILESYHKTVAKNSALLETLESDVQEAFVEASSMTPSSSWYRCMNLLLQAGAGVNRPDKDGFLPLTKAIKNSHVEAVVLLLRNGCDVNMAGNRVTYDEQDHQMTSLTLAVDLGNTQIVKLLLKAGASNDVDVDAADTRKLVGQCRVSFSLMDWSRVAVRRQLYPRSVVESSQEVQIPATLKSFVAMR